MCTTVNCHILLYMYTDTVPRDLYFDFWLVFRCEDMHQIWCPFPSFVGLATHLTATLFSYLLCGLCTTKAGVFNLIWLYCCALATAYCNFATIKDNKLFYLIWNVTRAMHVRFFRGGSNSIFVHSFSVHLAKIWWPCTLMYIKNVQKVGNPWKRIKKCPKHV